MEVQARARTTRSRRVLVDRADITDEEMDWIKLRRAVIAFESGTWIDVAVALEIPLDAVAIIDLGDVVSVRMADLNSRLGLT